MAPVKPRPGVSHRLDPANVIGRGGFKAEFDRLRKADAQRRERSTKRILGTDTIRDKDVDAASLLMTTLGGVPRAITLEDLRTFDRNAEKLGKRFKGGITAKGVIDASLKVDLDRANSQIRTAVVSRAQAGKLLFVTNAGPNSDKTRHLVHVEFDTFASYTARAADPKKLARAMLNGPLRFECDCGRFTFWYRYIATRGRFVAGRREPGYPRVRNPNLAGVACKHALRVMQAIRTDALALTQTAKMIAAGQAGANSTAMTLTAKAAREAMQTQLAQAHHKRNLAETSIERAKRLAGTPAAKARALVRAVADAKRKAEDAKRKTRQGIADVTKKLGALKMTAAQRDALIKMLSTMQTED